ncbi:MAG TPA: hypothetical protein VFO80_02170 [Sphingomonas sp.]|nr:hypothetical protein [Sphingomonas sp.]
MRRYSIRLSAMTIGAGVLAPSVCFAQSAAYISQISEAQTQRVQSRPADAVTNAPQGGATVSQTGNSAALARVSQAGRANRADVVQSGSTVAYADLAQTGDANHALIGQFVGTNSAIVRQTGNDNVLLSVQSASSATGSNYLSVSQTGDANTASIGQDGDGNRLELSQTGSKTASIVQRGDSSVSLAQIGAGADSIALDMAPGMSMTVERYPGMVAPGVSVRTGK